MSDVDETLIPVIRERTLHVLRQIAEAGIRSGNTGTRLVVVSKFQPVEVVRAAVEAGVSALGENYAEEAVEKISALGQTAVEWHMIGHVQSRKADLVAANFTMLHSLDSIKLAARLDRSCAEKSRSLPVLVEVNVSGEESKFGVPAWDEANWHHLLPTFESLLMFPNLDLRGLMTMPPIFDDPEKTRPYFRRLRRLQAFLMKHLPQATWSELSMGTSIDFLTAVEEGSTYVRVGQAILGPRPRKKD